ncbi:MAG TPA: acyl transferase [Edaphocola sp.]|nr:acyl transferase [Edaphocola sp.]
MSENISIASDWLPSIHSDNFNEKALQLFQFQYWNIPVYQQYCNYIHKHPQTIKSITQIPFLPISFFKSHKVFNASLPEKLIFESSGTTGMTPSRHYIAHPEYYEYAFLKGFKQFYGDPKDYIFLGLLPSYLERQHSSLVYMVQHLMNESNHSLNGFYLDDWNQLSEILQKKTDRKIFFIGVTFALLDFAEAFPMNLKDVIVMETGGMKGRKEEWTRMQVHDFLKRQWNLKSVHSEFGMSEMLSQAYSKGNGIFKTSSTLKVLLRDENDPLCTFEKGSGCINVIDLANIDSCAFIATEDIGKVSEDNTFEVLGRRDSAALRGCSLMVV